MGLRLTFGDKQKFSIDLIVLLLFVSVFKIYAIPQVMQQAQKIICLSIVFIYFWSKRTKMLNKGLLLSAVYAFSCILAFLAGYNGTRALLDGILNAICIYLIYLAVQHYSQIGEKDSLIHDIFKITGLYCLISLFSIAVVGRPDSVFESLKIYFFGNKFFTSYYFLFFCALFYAIKCKKIEEEFNYRALYYSMCLFFMIVCFYMNCVTGVIGFCAFIVMFFLRKRAKKLVTSKYFFLLCIIGASLIVFSITALISMPSVQYVITQIFHKDVTLTGRTGIYAILTDIISKRPFLGYGYNNSIIENLIGYGNAQNGLMQLVCESGIIGALTFIWIVYVSISKASKEIRYTGFYLFVFAMIVCSISEISFNYFFYLALFILMWSDYPAMTNLQKQTVS